jgi:hypothetical protein
LGRFNDGSEGFCEGKDVVEDVLGLVEIWVLTEPGDVELGEEGLKVIVNQKYTSNE